MQDYPKLLLQAKKQLTVNDQCLVVTFPRFMAWSPVKNDYERAAALKAKTGFEESPRSGEADIMELFRQQLLSVNTCPICNPDHEERIKIEEGAYICLWPESGVITEELHSHIGKNVVIKKGSVLVVRCRNWYLDNVVIDGCCVIGDPSISERKESSAKISLEHVTIENKGWHYMPVDINDPAVNIIFRMRGYKVKRDEQCELTATSIGDFSLKDASLMSSAKITFSG